MPRRLQRLSNDTVPAKECSKCDNSCDLAALRCSSGELPCNESCVDLDNEVENRCDQLDSVQLAVTRFLSGLLRLKAAEATSMAFNQTELDSSMQEVRAGLTAMGVVIRSLRGVCDEVTDQCTVDRLVYEAFLWSLQQLRQLFGEGAFGVEAE